MKYIAALFFVLNGAAFVWMRTLPDDSEVSRVLLYEDMADLSHDTTGKAAALAMQVEAGRGYEQLFVKYKTAGTLLGGLLLANAGVLLFAAIRLAQQARGNSNTESIPPDIPTASHSDA